MALAASAGSDRAPSGGLARVLGISRKARRLWAHRDLDHRLPPAPRRPTAGPTMGIPPPTGGRAGPPVRKPAPPGLRPDTRKAKSPSGCRVPRRPAGPRPPGSPDTRPAGAAHLAQLLAAHGAVPLLAQHPHLGGAAVAHRVVAAPQRRGLHPRSTSRAVSPDDHPSPTPEAAKSFILYRKFYPDRLGLGTPDTQEDAVGRNSSPDG